MLRSRRRPRYGAPICFAVLLLLSATLLYMTLTSTTTTTTEHDASPLLTDTTDLDFSSSDSSSDPIDLSDTSLLEDPTAINEEEEDDDDDDGGGAQGDKNRIYYYDHLGGVVRRGYNRRAIEEWDDYGEFDVKLARDLGFQEGEDLLVFASDDVPVEERIRERMADLGDLEEVFLLKGSRLREGWGEWFDKKGDFLRKDKMLRSNLEGLNPLNNVMLQDPDGVGVTGFSRGDKLVLKGIMSAFKSLPLVSNSPRMEGKDLTEMKRAERRTLDHSSDFKDKVNNEKESAVSGAKLRGNLGGRKMKNEFSGEVYADGKRWGYYPGLDGNLSFTNFMDMFFKRNCSVRVFMVWNSPPWAFGVRHKRGIESVLFHHPDACVVVFSETIELNFFSEFVDEGFKIAVVMPNLDELLNNTPTHIFASVWYEWKQTKYYPVHYSELIRLAVLYKYGGVYLDSDIIVLKPISSLFNSVGMEDKQDGSTLNGAIMASDKHSHFIMECLKEFYASYDDTNLRWNGADLLGRVAGNLSSSQNQANKVSELMLLPRPVSFPFNHREIPRYFAAPKTEVEITEQDIIFKKILQEYATLHLWNSRTSALVPEPNSLVARILNKHCIHCSDVL